VATEIDLAFLAGQTGGDPDLAREVLAMFVRQVPAEVDRLAAAGPAEQREIAHRLVGSAAAIGAIAVAEAARAIEDGGGDVSRLRDAVARAIAFIQNGAE
jgi:HPt (histidine-containing phosphotransfer) domain-containing protein